jgi:hypothetical protein
MAISTKILFKVLPVAEVQLIQILGLAVEFTVDIVKIFVQVSLKVSLYACDNNGFFVHPRLQKLTCWIFCKF